MRMSWRSFDAGMISGTMRIGRLMRFKLLRLWI